MSRDSLYHGKMDSYFNQVRLDLLKLIPQRNRNGRMFDVGAGVGNTLMTALERGFASALYGIELKGIENSNQDRQEYESFIIGDIEKTELPFEEELFDVILCGDIIEHLNNPQDALDKLFRYAKPGGVIIASIPNIRHYSIVMPLLFRGDFRYTEMGLMDKSHLRWFCRRNMVELFEQSGFVIETVISSVEYMGRKSKRFNHLTLRLFEGFLSRKYFIVGRKEPAGAN